MSTIEIGEDKSLLSEYLGKNISIDTETTEVPASEIADSENNSTDKVFDDEIPKDSLLFDFISKEKTSTDVETDYKSQYDENVKSGKWTEVEDADNIDWNEKSFKAIEEAQSKSSDKNATNTKVSDISEDVEFRQNRIEALNNTDFNDIENAKELLKLYRVMQEGKDKSTSIDKQIAALDNDEVIQYAKTISAKIVKDDESYIESEKERQAEEAKAQEESWNKYEASVIEVGSKMKLTAAASKEKLDSIKSGEFNKKFWELISNPEKFHKVYDFLMDIDKYEEKIKAKTNSKLVVEAITKKNINTEAPKTNFGKINIPI